MTTLEEKLEKEQLIYQQNYNENLLKNESKKKLSKFLLICGIIIIVFEFILNLLIIGGIGAGLTFSECEGYGEIKQKCEEDLRKKDKKLSIALLFIIPCLFITCIFICLCFSYNKKIIIINCICIIIKLSLFIGYLINLQYTQDNFGLISFLILPEISSDICFIMSEKLKLTIKK